MGFVDLFSYETESGKDDDDVNEIMTIVLGLAGGLAIFLYGMNMMSTSLQEAAGERMRSILAAVTRNPIVGVLAGAFATAVLQNFAAQPGVDGASIIGLEGAIPILLGDNLGTTVTALLASIGQSRDAKRVALAHCIFNLSGCLLFVGLTGPFASLVAAIPPAGEGVEVIARQIANAHTCFNVIMTLIWLPLVPLMVKLVMLVLPERPSRPRNLGTSPGSLAPEDALAA